MNEYAIINGELISINELYHHGVKGMKWGVRKQRAITNINRMYDRSNKWTNRKIEKLDTKGKTAKADVMRYMVKNNEVSRKTKINKISKMSEQEFKNQMRKDRRDTFFGGQISKSRNMSGMTTISSRFLEYHIHRGMRWMSNITLNSTLDSITKDSHSVKEGYEYLNRKFIRSASRAEIKPFST